jgi:capsular polysaccharide biosynthesis protein
MDDSLKAIEAKRSRLDDLSRAVQIDDSAYRALALHLEDARVIENRVRDRISHGAVIAQPSLPYKAARPRYLITAIATVFAALLIGIAAALVLEQLDDRFTSTAQVEKKLGIPVLAVFGERGS